MTKLEMWEKTFVDKPSEITNGTIFLEELYKELTWKETYSMYVILNWFRLHDKHRFLQYRSQLFYAGDIRGVYDVIQRRYNKEMKMRGKRV